MSLTYQTNDADNNNIYCQQLIHHNAVQCVLVTLPDFNILVLWACSIFKSNLLDTLIYLFNYKQFNSITFNYKAFRIILVPGHDRYKCRCGLMFMKAVINTTYEIEFERPASTRNHVVGRD